LTQFEKALLFASPLHGNDEKVGTETARSLKRKQVICVGAPGSVAKPRNTKSINVANVKIEYEDNSSTSNAFSHASMDMDLAIRF